MSSLVVMCIKSRLVRTVCAEVRNTGAFLGLLAMRPFQITGLTDHFPANHGKFAVMYLVCTKL